MKKPLLACISFLALAGCVGPTALVPNQRGELEVAVSPNGQNVVVATNNGFAFSANGGQTFTDGGAIPAGFPHDGDPSLALGQSGAFYLAFIGSPNGTMAALNQTGCATSVDSSTNNGQTFAIVGHATVCPNGQNACFPDQEHIAADRFNPAAGGDQVYSVWRNFLPTNAGPNVVCGNIRDGTQTASLTCSNNGGQTWAARTTIGAGDFPRVAVGRDSFVYVVLQQNKNVVLYKYSSCANGLALQRGWPVTVSSSAGVVCPVPGLDRCNDGNVLSSPTVAIDDLNGNHVFVAFATNTAGNNEDVLVFESLDGGRTFARQTIANGTPAGRRFMPWLCATGGAAFASWYDRRAAGKPLPVSPACTSECETQRDVCLDADLGLSVCGPAYQACLRRCQRWTSNDLTEYFWAQVRPLDGSLQSIFEWNASRNPDPQCASGWSSVAPRAVQDSESCSVQPQLAGVCCTQGAGGCTGSMQRCDFSSSSCPSGESCNTGRGAPKYGDYNGNACINGRAYFAWASATTPQGAPAGTGLRVFFQSSPAPATLTIQKRVSPSGQGFTITVDGIVVGSNVGNLGLVGPLSLVPGTHTVREQGSNLINYDTSYSGDCGPDGRITLTAGSAKTCTIANIRRPVSECLQDCVELRDDCMAEVGQPGGLTAAQCAQLYNNCKAHCQ